MAKNMRLKPSRDSQNRVAPFRSLGFLIRTERLREGVSVRKCAAQATCEGVGGLDVCKGESLSGG